MAVLKKAIRWVDPSGTTRTLTDVQKVNARKGTDIKHNTMEFTLQNNSSVSRSYVENNTVLFSPEQDVEFYCAYDDGTLGSLVDPSNLVFSGRVVEFEGSVDDAKTPLKVVCSDSSFIVLNKNWVGSETDTPPELIKGIIGFVNDSVTSVGKRVSAELTSSGGEIAALDSDDNAFSDYSISKVFKPAYEVIQELSQPDATGDPAPYRFHVDRNNVFHWFYPDDSVEHVMIEGETGAPNEVSYQHPISGALEEVTDSNSHKILNFKLKKAVYDVTNFIIYKAGQDLNDVQILDFKFDSTSGSPVTKDAYRSWEDISRGLKRAEEETGNLSLDKNDEYSIVNSSGTTSWGESYSSSSDYNDKFVARCKLIAASRAEALFQKTGSPRYKGKIELQGRNLYDANDALFFVSAREGIRTFLRVSDVQHNVSDDGWFTTLQVEEEIPRN